MKFWIKNSINNLKGKKTFLSGLLLFLASIYSVFLSELGINWTEATPIILISLVLMGIKDPRKKHCEHGKKETKE